VALTHDDWEALRAGLGATHVVRADGSPVEYATRVGLDSVGSRPQDASELEIVLRDPTGGEIRRMRGDLAVKLEQARRIRSLSATRLKRTGDRPSGPEGRLNRPRSLRTPATRPEPNQSNLLTRLPARSSARHSIRESAGVSADGVRSRWPWRSRPLLPQSPALRAWTPRHP
jgi:hypothetical protein